MNTEQMTKYLSDYNFKHGDDVVLDYFLQIAKFDQTLASSLLCELLSVYSRADAPRAEIEELRSILDNRNLRIQTLENELRNRNQGGNLRITISGFTDRKINFIKLVREFGGFGLEESVENLLDRSCASISIFKQINCLEPCRVIDDLRSLGLIVN